MPVQHSHMVDSPTTTSAPSSTRTKQQVWLKRLQIPAIKDGQRDQFLTALQQIITSITNTNLSKVTIVDPFRLTFAGSTRPAQSYSVEFKNRPTEGDTDQAVISAQTEKMYLDDVAVLLLDVANWIEAAFPKTPAANRFAKNDTLDNVRELVTNSFEGIEPDFAKLNTKRTELLNLAAEISESLESLITSAGETTSGYDSLRPLVAELERDPAQALALWSSDILVLAQAVRDTKQLPTQAVVSAQPLSTVRAVHGNRFSPPEVRLVLHTFSKALQTIFKDSDGTKKYLNRYLAKENQNRPINAILDPRDLELLLSESSPFFFRPELSAADLALASEQELRDSDIQQARAFYTFFTKKEVFGRIFGKETLPELAGEAGTEAAAEAGGSEETKEEKPPETTTPTLIQFSTALNEVNIRITNAIIDELNLRGIGSARLERLVWQQLFSDMLQRLEGRAYFDLQSATLDPQGKVYDAATRSVVSNLFEIWAGQYVPVAVATFMQRIGQPATYRQTILSWAETEVAVFEGKMELAPEAVPVNNATVLLALSKLTQLVQTGDRGILPGRAEDFNSSWWSQLPLAERRRLTALVLGPTIGTGAEKVRLANALAINYFGSTDMGFDGFDPTQLTGGLRDQFVPIQNLFLQNIETTLAELNYEDFVRCLNNPTYARLFVLNRIRSRLNQDPRFQASVQAFLQARTQEQRQAAAKALAGDAAADGILALQLDQSVDSLLVTFQDETSAKRFVDSLTPTEIARHFGRSLSEEQAARFKKELNKLLSERYKTENALLNQRLRGEGLSRQSGNVGLFTYDDDTDADEREQLQDSLDRYREVLRTVNVRTVISAAHTPYSYVVGQTEPTTANEEAIAEWRYRQAFVQNLWKELELAGLTEAAKADPNFTPSVLIQELNSNRKKTLSAKTLGGRAKNYFHRLRGGKEETVGNAVQKATTGAAEMAAAQAAGMAVNAAVPGLGTALNAVSTGLERLGIKKRYQALGGLMIVLNFPFTFLGAGLGAAIGGFFFGPAGASIGAGIGGGIGFAADVVYKTGADLLGGAKTASAAGQASLGEAQSVLGGTPAAATPATTTGAAAAATRVPFIATPTAPVVIATVGTAVVSTVTIMAIQNSLIDPLTITPQATEYSQYVEISKKVLPAQIENNQATDITYTIEITPREDYVIVPGVDQTTDTFSYLGGDALTLPDQTEAVRQQLGSDPITGKKTITYTVPAVSGVDVQVNNKFHFVFQVQGITGDVQVLDVIGSLTIGDPEIGCFTFAEGGQTFGGGEFAIQSKAWNDKDRTQVLSAFNRRAGTNSNYISLLCEKGPVELYRLPGGGGGSCNGECGGWAPAAYGGNKVGIYDPGVQYSIDSTEYTLVHELGHAIDYRNGNLRTNFNTIWSGRCYTYPFPAVCSSGSGEAFPEAMVLYVISKTYRFSINDAPQLFDFQGRYQAEYNWMRDNIFGGQEFN